MNKIFVTLGEGAARDTFMPANIKARLEALGSVSYNNSPGRLSEQMLADSLPGVDICVTGWGCPRFSDAVLDKADRLRLIAHLGGSVANHVGAEVFERGIRVITGNDIFALVVAEGTVAYMMLGLRRLAVYAERVQRGLWADDSWHNESLINQPVGLVGFGAIARHLVPMLRPYNCEISAYDPFVPDELFAQYGVRKAPLLDIARENKIVSVHASKTEGSRHIICREFLDNMRDGALLVNTARGSVIDEGALADVAAAGRIRAVLDVFEVEPLPADSSLRGLENVTLIPHMGGPTTDKRELVSACVLDDIERYLIGGRLKHEVEREYALRMTNEHLK